MTGAAATTDPTLLSDIGCLLLECGRRDNAYTAFRRGADQGGAAAMHNLGVLYKQDGLLDEAERWWRAACEHGNTETHNSLAGTAPPAEPRQHRAHRGATPRPPVALVTPAHPRYPTVAVVAAQALTQYCPATQTLDAFQEARALAHQALATTSAGHPNRPTIANLVAMLDEAARRRAS